MPLVLADQLVIGQSAVMGSRPLLMLNDWWKRINDWIDRQKTEPGPTPSPRPHRS